MIDISKAFATNSETIAGFFQQPGAAYYIPLYQREYSWDVENVAQLMEDIFNGIKSLLQDPEESGGSAIHFMGTVILFHENHPKQNIQPRDDRALPTRIDNVIDGQQRISTIAVLACVLLKNLLKLRSQLPKDNEFDSLRTEIDSKKDLLLELFSVDIKRGKPFRKPIIVRGSVDGWTFDGNDKDNYKSGVSSYLAAVISSFETNSLDALKDPEDVRVSKNVKKMEEYLKKVLDLDGNESEEYPKAKQILEGMSPEALWTYDRAELNDLVFNEEKEPDKSKIICRLVQLFSFMHYFTDRCCFTVIKPVSEEWAFDMFQSLNASGTPLTAIETFKPLVVNYIAQEGKIYKDTDSNKYFSKVDVLVNESVDSTKKNKLTDEFLTIFALAHDGHSLSSQFSMQRGYLNKRLRSYDSSEEREEFIRQMGDLAEYWSAITSFDPGQNIGINGLSQLSVEEREVSGICILFLKDSGHKMAQSVLSRFYAKLIRSGSVLDAQEFVEACKAVAAFYFIWRSAKSNSGLDEVYRKLLKTGVEGISPPMSAVYPIENITISNLKRYLQDALGELTSKEVWLIKSCVNLRFNSAKPMCKFALFLSAHESLCDDLNPGLMKIAVEGSAKYFNPQKWKSKDLRTIEHIAPIKGKDEWDSNIYEGDQVHLIGNLTLLPGNINSSMGNKSWTVKKLYYNHLAQKDPEHINSLSMQASELGIELDERTIEILKNASYFEHIEPLMQVSRDGWTSELIQLRTQRICEISWTRVAPWLDLD